MTPTKAAQVVIFKEPLNELEKDAKFTIREIFLDVLFG